MPYAEVNGQRLFYNDSGSGDDVIVFSHGLFMDQTMFDAQVRAIEDRWRCIAWDERGHGQTQTTPARSATGTRRAICSVCSTTSASSGRCWPGCRRAASSPCARR